MEQDGSSAMESLVPCSTVTMSKLILRIAERRPKLSLRDSEFVVKVLVGALVKNLVEGNRIEIRGFGSFDINMREARVGRNPKSGEQVLIPKKRTLRFKAGKALRQCVDSSRSQETVS